MNNITLEEFKQTKEYQEFIEKNPDEGTLKVQVFTADQAIPIADTEIYITKEIGDYNVLFFQGVTNSSGIIDNIKLPAPHEIMPPPIDEVPFYTNYQLTASNEKLKFIKQYEISMFGNVDVLQYIKIHVSDGEASGK